MVKSNLHGLHRVYNPRMRTVVAHRAQLSKTRPGLAAPVKGSQQVNLRHNFPINRLGSEEGCARLSVLLGILGGSGGFIAGSAMQFNILKDTIAKVTGIPLEDIYYWDFILHPTSPEDFGSIMASGLIGVIFGAELTAKLPRLFCTSDNNQ